MWMTRNRYCFSNSRRSFLNEWLDTHFEVVRRAQHTLPLRCFLAQAWKRRVLESPTNSTRGRFSLSAFVTLTPFHSTRSLIGSSSQTNEFKTENKTLKSRFLGVVRAGTRLRHYTDPGTVREETSPFHHVDTMGCECGCESIQERYVPHGS